MIYSPVGVFKEYNYMSSKYNNNKNVQFIILIAHVYIIFF